MITIKDIQGRMIIDSRGNPTVEADVILEDGSIGRAAAPATGIAKRHNANQNLIKKLALHSPLKSVIKEKIGVSFIKFKNLPTNE